MGQGEEEEEEEVDAALLRSRKREERDRERMERNFPVDAHQVGRCGRDRQSPSTVEISSANQEKTL